MTDNILAWSMTKNKHKVIKNYVILPDKLVLSNPTTKTEAVELQAKNLHLNLELDSRFLVHPSL